MSDQTPEATISASEAINHGAFTAAVGWFGGVVAATVVNGIDNFWIWFPLALLFVIGYTYFIERKINHWYLHRILDNQKVVNRPDDDSL